MSDTLDSDLLEYSPDLGGELDAAARDVSKAMYYQEPSSRWGSRVGLGLVAAVGAALAALSVPAAWVVVVVGVGVGSVVVRAVHQRGAKEQWLATYLGDQALAIHVAQMRAHRSQLEALRRSSEDQQLDRGLM